MGLSNRDGGFIGRFRGTYSSRGTIFYPLLVCRIKFGLHPPPSTNQLIKVHMLHWMLPLLELWGSLFSYFSSRRGLPRILKFGKRF